FGWRALFIAPLPLIVVSAFMLRVSGFPSRDEPRSTFRDFTASFDFVGTLLIGVGLSAFVGGSKLTGTTFIAVSAAAALTLAAFVVWELRAKNPVLDPRLFK